MVTRGVTINNLNQTAQQQIQAYFNSDKI